MNQPFSRSRQLGFSLIELVVVVAIIVIIAAFTVPVLNTALRGSQLSQASTLLVGQFSLARQQAMTRNHQVEVRFYRYGDPEVPGEKISDPTTGKFRAVQLFEVQESGVALPIDKAQPLPNSVIFSYSDSSLGLSSIIDAASAGKAKTASKDDPNAPPMPRGIGLNYQYVSFRFMQDGSTNLPPIGNSGNPSGTWYITLIGSNDHLASPAQPPPNFFTVQIDPVSGATRNYRPTVNAG